MTTPTDTTEVKPLSAWRNFRLHTLRSLAQEAGVPHATVYRIEHGKVRPTQATIKKLSYALDIDPALVEEFRATMGLSSENTR